MKLASLILLTSIAAPLMAQAVPDPTRQLDATESQSILDKYKVELQQLSCADSIALSGTEHGGSTPLNESSYIEIRATDTKNAPANRTIHITFLRSTSTSSLKFECNHPQ